MPQTVNEHLPSEKDLRAYAAGQISWKVMRDKGFNFYQVLDGLGFFGIQQQIPDTPESRATSDRILQVFRDCEAQNQSTGV